MEPSETLERVEANSSAECGHGGRKGIEGQRQSAVAEGFSSSWAEYESHIMERDQQQAHEAYEKRMEEQAASLRKSVEELYHDMEAEHPHRYVPRYMASPMLPCDCDEHLNPFFRPRSLAIYRSMNNGSVMDEFLEKQLRIQMEELALEPGDTSRRLDDETVEVYWARNSHVSSLKLPSWTKQDVVLQRIVDADRRSKTACLDDLDYSTLSPVSIGSESGAFDDATTAQSSPRSLEGRSQKNLQYSQIHESHGIETEKKSDRSLRQDLIPVRFNLALKAKANEFSEAAIRLDHNHGERCAN